MTVIRITTEEDVEFEVGCSLCHEPLVVEKVTYNKEIGLLGITVQPCSGRDHEET